MRQRPARPTELPRVDPAQHWSYSRHMPSALKVKTTHKAVKSYYAALATYADQSVQHEGALRSAFQNLLSETGRKVRWTLIPELSLDANGHQIRPHGTFRDEFTIERGYWEAKDTDDDLEPKIKKKIKRGYRLTNTIFEPLPKRNSGVAQASSLPGKVQMLYIDPCSSSNRSG